jgi:hypothetical protein
MIKYKYLYLFFCIINIVPLFSQITKEQISECERTSSYLGIPTIDPCLIWIIKDSDSTYIKFDDLGLNEKNFIRIDFDVFFNKEDMTVKDTLLPTMVKITDVWFKDKQIQQNSRFINSDDYFLVVHKDDGMPEIDKEWIKEMEIKLLYKIKQWIFIPERSTEKQIDCDYNYFFKYFIEWW